MKFTSLLSVVLLTIPILNIAYASSGTCVQIVSEEESEIIVSFNPPEPEIITENLEGEIYSKVFLENEAQIGIEGFPDLPAIHRTFIVPPRARIQLKIVRDNQTTINVNAPPAVYRDNPDDQDLQDVQQFNHIFPRESFVLHDPVIFRGTRMVTVTHYPYQYNPTSRSYIHHQDAEIALQFNSDDPGAINPVISERNVTLTRGSYRLLHAMAMNAPHRDDNGDTLPRGGYLIVAGTGNVFEDSEEILRLADWKRACGHQVEIEFSNNLGDIQDMIETGYEEWEPPLEYVCVIGTRNNPPAPNGREGDVVYGHLEGRDHVAEVAVSRLDANSGSRLCVVINRSLGYQAAPYTEDMDWFGTAGSVSYHVDGWYDGVNHTMHWVAEAARRAGFDEVKQYYAIEQNNDGSPRQWWQDGINILFVRGAELLGNPGQDIFPVYFSAGGGHVENSWTSLWRYGSPQSLTGPSIVAGSEHNQGTMACNVLIGGMARGLLVEKMPVGWARAFAMSMLDYGNVNNANYDYYLQEFRMYAEPGQLIWCGPPSELLVEHSDRIYAGQNLMEILVADAEQEVSIPGALVTLTKPGELLNWDFTDAFGRCVLSLDPDQEDDIILTVTGDGLLPYQAEIEWVVAPVYVNGYLSRIDDDEEGNNDGEMNPGETVALRITASNMGDDDVACNVEGLVTSDCPWITIENPELDFGDIEPEEESHADEDLIVSISNSAHETDILELHIEFEYNDQSTSCAIPIELVGHHFDVVRVVGGEILDYELTDLDLELVNSGSQTSPDVGVQLVSSSWEIQILQDESQYEPIASHQSSRLSGNSFRVSPVSFAIPGSRVLMYLLLSAQEEDIPDTVKFYLQVGEPDEGSPQGPDEYGYICVDDTDVEWGVAPVFDWIEISSEARDPDYEGTLIEENSADFTAEIELPFTFRYYGREFDDATVSENGFLALGTGLEELRSGENYPLDQFVTGSFGMIAPFWDQLRVTRNNDAGIYTFFEEDLNIFIIEWYNTIYSDQRNEFHFQIILYNQEFYPNPSGDGDILFQYKDIPGPHRGDAPTYFSTGICSPDGNIGINYVDNNEYPVTSAEIEDERAIFFTTSMRNATGVLYGRVIDAADNQPVHNATVVTKFGQIAFTDEDGNWEIEDAIAEFEFNITALKQGYNDTTKYNYELEEDGELRIDFSMLHPYFVASTHHIGEILDPFRSSQIPFTVSNTGNGPLDWILERKLHGDANAAPWEFRRSFSIGAVLDDDHLEGVAFAGNHFFVSGGNSGNPTIYRFDRDGALIDTFPQFNREYNRGMRDMTWDGQLLWSTVNDSIYGFTTDGELRHVFGGFRDLLPFRPVTNIAYDDELHLLWVSGTTTDIIALTRDAQLVDSLEIDRKGLRIYGLDCYEDDIDGYILYAVTKEEGTNRHKLIKFNTFTGDTIHVAYLDHEIESGTAGMCITNQFDVYSWIIAEIASAGDNHGGDRIDLWQVEGRKDWFQVDLVEEDRRVEADSGRIESGDVADYILTFDSTDLPDTLFGGELLFSHNSDSGKGHIEISLEVIGPVPPLPFDLVSPADGDTLDSTNVSFTWNPSIDYNFGEEPTYRLQIMSEQDSVIYSTMDTVFTVDIDTLFGLDLEVRADFNWSVKAFSDPDSVSCIQPFSFRFIPSWILGDDRNVPVEFGLHSVYPNPFNSTTTVRFGIDHAVPTTLTVYDLAGRKVKELYTGTPEVGYHQVVWNAESIPSGLYLLRLTSLSGVRIAKLALVK